MKNKSKKKSRSKNETIPPGCLKIDVQNLSQKSIDNSSISPLALKTYYQDIEFTCIGCGKNDIFTAAQQKHRYEVLKKIIHQKKVRCESCQQELNELKKFIPNITKYLKEETYKTSELLEKLHRFKKLNRGRYDTELEFKLLLKIEKESE